MTVKTADGATINTRVTEGEQPAVVFVHGWANNQTIWDEEVISLENKAITFDLRGHGCSTRGSQKISLNVLVDDLHRVIEEKGISEYILVGHSLGGMLVLHHEARFSTAEYIVVMDTSAKPIGNKMSQFLSETISLPDLFHWKDEDTPIENYASSDILTFLQGLPSTSTNTIWECFEAMHHNEVTTTLSTPATVIRGTNDYLLPEPYTKSVRSVLTDSDMVRVADAGHFPQLQRPAVINEVLKTVIDQCQVTDPDVSASSDRRNND